MYARTLVPEGSGNAAPSSSYHACVAGGMLYRVAYDRWLGLEQTFADCSKLTTGAKIAAAKGDILAVASAALMMPFGSSSLSRIFWSILKIACRPVRMSCDVEMHEAS